MREEKGERKPIFTEDLCARTDTNPLQLYSWEMLLSENIKVEKYDIFHMGVSAPHNAGTA